MNFYSSLKRKTDAHLLYLNELPVHTGLFKIPFLIHIPCTS